MSTDSIGIYSALAVGTIAAAWDLRTRHIPNALTLGGVALGVALHVALGAVDGGSRGALVGALRALVGIVVCAAFPAFSFARNEMGGGDVKLFAAIGALCGPILGFNAQAWSFVVSLAVVLPWRLARQRVLGASLRNGLTAMKNVVRARSRRAAYVEVRLRPVVMGPTILAGLCVAAVQAGVLR